MINYIAESSFDRLNSLWHFYDSQRENIDRYAKKESLKWLSPAKAFVFLKLVTDGEQDRIEPKSAYKQFYEKFDDIFQKNDDYAQDNTQKPYRIKDLTPIEEMGISLDQVSNVFTELQKYDEMPQIHGSNTLILLVTRFEQFISDLLCEVVKKYPDKYLQNQSISYGDIAQMKSVNLDEISHLIIDRKVNSIMSEKYTEWFKLFKGHGMKFSKCQQELGSLREIYSRRNSWVHNGGRVNLVYLSQVNNSELREGDTLEIDYEYLKNAFSTIKKIMVTLLIESARLELTSDREYFYDEIFNLLFKCLKNKEYDVCVIGFDQLYCVKEIDDLNRAYSKINYWISYIETKGLECIRQEIADYAFPIEHPSLYLARELLLQNYEIATDLLEKMMDEGEFTASAIERFPIFEKYKKTQLYQNLRNKYPVEFNVAQIENAEEKKTDIDILIHSAGTKQEELCGV